MKYAIVFSAAILVLTVLNQSQGEMRRGIG